MESAQHPKLDLEKQVSNIVPDEDLARIITKPHEDHLSDTSSERIASHAAAKEIEKEAGTTSTAPPTAPEGPPVEDEPVYPSNKKLVPIMGSLYLSFFLIALDRTILATAIPRITDEFDSLGDVGWYGSAYMLCMCGFQLFFARLYTFYSPKVIYLSAILLFEIGSAVCGAAPNSLAFILGRAIAGLGSAGAFSGAIMIIVYSVPLHKRPVYQGMIGSIFGIASVAGPLLGGVFTTEVTWRWCFYINLPIGGAAMVILYFILHIPSPAGKNTPLKEQFWRLDPYGSACFLPGIICLLLALQWGGTTYAWSDGRIIALFVLFGVLIAAFIGVQIWKQEMGTVPPRIATQRSIAAGMWTQFCNGGSFMVVIYFLPIWFQAIKNVTAVKSGIMNIPLILSLVVASISAGIAVNKVGYYTPFILASIVIMSIGAGLLTTFTPETMHPKWIGYQVIFGFGLGLGMQQSTLAAQTVLPHKDAATGVGLIMFMMQMGGAIFVSVAQNVFTNELARGVMGVPNLDPKQVVRTGATDIRKVVPAEELPRVVSAYNHALVKGCFDLALALAASAILGAVWIEFRSVKEKKNAADLEAAKRRKQSPVEEE